MRALLLFASLTAADYTNFYFNSSNGCPGLGIGCYAPDSMCAYDSVNDKYYCCSGSSYDICRAFAATCEGSDGGPSTSQQECTSGSSSWCCLGSGNERCTSRTGQINVCVATQENPIANVPDLLMNETYSSLSSANPIATSYSVDVTSLAERATAVSTTSSSSSTTTSSAASTTTSTGPTSATANPDGGSTPTGAIAGGVVGGVAVLAIIGGMIWFFCARKRKAEAAPSSPTTAEKREDQFGFASPASGVHSPAPQYQLAEMEGTRELGEMPGSGGEEGKRLMGGHVSEMPAGQDGVRELPG